MYVKIDDMLRDWPDLAPVRPATGTPLTLSDAELLTMAVMSALLGFTSERRGVRDAGKELAGGVPRAGGRGGGGKGGGGGGFPFFERGRGGGGKRGEIGGV